MIAANLFHYVSEQEDNFLALFPHRYDYIWAEYPDVQEAIDWKTESRHPLTDRLIHQGQYVYGVRFAAETQYSVIDIDTMSRYHPKHDPFAISRIVAALEPLGFVAYVACTSSDSGGIHLYVPFQQKQKSWKLAIALQTLLENAGFKPAAGQLEIFPNPKRYATERTPSLYAAHRLPMQIGSYLLNEDWQLTYSNQAIFVERWQFAQAKNDVCSEAIDQALSTFRRKQYGISGRVDKFLNDLNADIEAGWTGQGQTNFILGRIAMRSYIFGHLLYADCPLEGKPLVDDIVKTARSLPGYQEWCRHQHEIEKRAEEWARCIENSRYFHFGRSKLAPAVLETADSSPQSSWNQKQSESARERICKAIADLLNQNALPFGATARFHALTQYGIGGGSLYRHRDLWHPNFLKADLSVENPPDPPNALTNVSVDATPLASTEIISTSLFSSLGGNAASCKGSNPFVVSDSPLPGRNASQHTGLSDIELTIRTATANIERTKYEAQFASQVAQMQQFLQSGDPILISEAITWIEANPALLDAAKSYLPTVQLDRVQLNQEPFLPGYVRRSPSDLSSVLVKISVELRRLAWTPKQIHGNLEWLFGKHHRARLTNTELVRWLEWLEMQDSHS